MASRPGQAASVLFYFSLVLVAASSVAFGLDWMKAPLPPMPETEASVQAAKLAAHLPPPPQPAIAKATPRSVYPTRSQPQAGPAVASVEPTAKEETAAPGAPSITAPEPTAAQPAAASTPPKCDVAACSAAYHSFRASDCTWQPFDGPRRLCDKGQPPQQQATNEAVEPSQYSDKCDIEACRRAYFTFDPTDCTYQPSNGARRLCSKGTPPKPATAEAPADEKAKQEAAAPAVSDKCDVEACKRAYVTFNPADCTYKRSLNGPRQLCTKGTPPKPEAKTEPNAAPAAAAPAQQTTAPPPATPAPSSEQAKQEAPAAAPSPAPTATPPAPAAPPAVAAPPTAAPNSEQAKQEAPAATPAPAPTPTPPAAAAAPVSDKCDVEACKRAYHTFNPADCTYKPSYGPRRLCTKGTRPKTQAAAPAAGRTPRPAPDHLVPPGLVPAGR